MLYNDIASTVGEPVFSAAACKRAVCESTKGVQQTECRQSDSSIVPVLAGNAVRGKAAAQGNIL